MEKKIAFQVLQDHLDEKITEARDYIEGLVKARDSDTKSSAGDKYETSREMVQQEIDRGEARLQQLFRQKNEVSRYDVNRVLDKCEAGALVQLDEVDLLLGPAIGRVGFQGKSILCISMGSPIGQLLKGKREGDEIQFNGKIQLIKKVL